MQTGVVVSLNCSTVKGVAKTPVRSVVLVEGHGVDTDAHAGPGDRQVSLLAIESIRKQKECSQVKKPDFQINAGDFAENITTEGIALAALKVGDRLNIGGAAVLEISKIGKECHKYCAIYYKIGDCIMPREGIFAKVITGSEIAVGDRIEVFEHV
jgi:MOSC domain-containing protein YiiM